MIDAPLNPQLIDFIQRSPTPFHATAELKQRLLRAGYVELKEGDRWQLQPGGIFAASEPSGSMNWYPSNNHPSDNETYTFTITVPAEYEVGMNGVLADQTSGALDGQPATTYVWDWLRPASG